jgi:hypothetical protein
VHVAVLPGSPQGKTYIGATPFSGKKIYSPSVSPFNFRT